MALSIGHCPSSARLPSLLAISSSSSLLVNGIIGREEVGKSESESETAEMQKAEHWAPPLTVDNSTRTNSPDSHLLSLSLSLPLSFPFPFSFSFPLLHRSFSSFSKTVPVPVPVRHASYGKDGESYDCDSNYKGKTATHWIAWTTAERKKQVRLLIKMDAPLRMLLLLIVAQGVLVCMCRQEGKSVNPGNCPNVAHFTAAVWQSFRTHMYSVHGSASIDAIRIEYFTIVWRMTAMFPLFTLSLPCWPVE